MILINKTTTKDAFTDTVSVEVDDSTVEVLVVYFDDIWNDTFTMVYAEILSVNMPCRQYPARFTVGSDSPDEGNVDTFLDWCKEHESECWDALCNELESLYSSCR